MSYYRQFNQFDPLTGAVPRVPFVALDEIAERARRLLRDATVAQIVELAETVEWIIDSAVVNAAEDAEARNAPARERAQRSDGQWLRDSIFYYDISPAAGARFPHHHHAFALLVLWLVDDASFSIQQEHDQLGNHSLVFAGDCAHRPPVDVRRQVHHRCDGGDLPGRGAGQPPCRCPVGAHLVSECRQSG